jgi:hypothetical protein
MVIELHHKQINIIYTRRQAMKIKLDGWGRVGSYTEQNNYEIRNSNKIQKNKTSGAMYAPTESSVISSDAMYALTESSVISSGAIYVPTESSVIRYSERISLINGITLQYFTICCSLPHTFKIYHI